MCHSVLYSYIVLKNKSVLAAANERKLGEFSSNFVRQLLYGVFRAEGFFFECDADEEVTLGSE